MGILSWLLGSQSEDDERIEQAEEYVESQWTSGLTRHYHAGAVVDSIRMDTGLTLTSEEAVEVVEKVRARHGWNRRDYSSYYPPFDEE